MSVAMHEARPIDVLLIEDSAADRDLVCAHLEDAHGATYVVRAVPTWADGRRELIAQLPDVLLIDLDLPDADGEALLEQAAATAGEIPVVVLTGKEVAAPERLIQCGADDFLAKRDMSAHHLHRAIGYALSRRHRRAMADVEARLEATARMAASVAHEINNPVAIISGSIEMIGRRCELLRSELLRHPETPASLRHIADELLGEIDDVVARNLDCVERISVVVSSLDAFARPDRRQLESLELGGLVEHAVRLAEHQTRWKTHVDLALDTMPPLVGNRDRLLRVIVNLLVNAGQSRPEGSAPVPVTIRASERQGHIVIDVVDRGDGIAPTVLDYVFEPFFTTRTDGRAAGLGLTVCRDIVHQHRGSIDIDSRVGEGTTVRVTLPLDNGLMAETAPPEPAPGQDTASAPRRVLLIDDEPLLRSVTTQLLEPEFSVTTANDGNDALSLLALDAEFDAVICDLMMPNMDGPAFFDAVGSVAPHLRQRLVFMTGGAFTPRAQAFLSEHPVAVLQKPFRRDDLLEALRQQMATAGLFAETAANSNAE